MLAVGKDLTLGYNGVNTGSLTYGHSLSPAGYKPPNGTATQAALPFNVKALFDALAVRGGAWNDLPAKVATLSGDTLTLTGTDRVRNVFSISAATFAKTRLIHVNVPSGSTLLINLPDGAYVDSNIQDITGATPEKTLWNFPTATSVQLHGTANWPGTIVVPFGAVDLGYKHIAGSIIANTITGTGEIGMNPFNGCLPDPTPCPPIPTVTPIPTTSPSPTPTSTPTATPTSTPTATPTRTPTPTPTRTPTPTPTRTPAPTPLPTVSPGPPPIVVPTATPVPSDPGEAPPGGDAGEVVIAGASSDVDICKKVMTPGGRALEEIHVRPGDTVRFRIRVTNLGTELAQNVVVCDLVPPGFTFVRATVKTHYRNGHPCATIPSLSGQREAFVWLRVTRDAHGKVTNVAQVTSHNGGTRRNPASVRVLPARAGGGGVTG